MRVVPCLAVLVFAPVLPSCGLSQPPDVQAPLRSFETASQQTADGLVSLYQHAIDLKVGLDTADHAKIDAFVVQFSQDLAQFDPAMDALEAAENSLQAQPSLGTSTGALTQGLNDGKGFMASVRKMFDLRGRYREWNQSMNDARNERDDATVDVGNAVPGAEARVAAAKMKMNQVGYAVIEDLGTNISTTLVTAPFKPVTLGGKLLKTVAGKAYQKGLVVITSTPACETDVTSKSCVLGLEHTDEQGQVKAPLGTNSVVVSGGGFARVRVDQTDFATPATAITRDLVPIQTVTASAITKGDEVDGDGFPVDPVYIPWIFCMVRPGMNADATGGTCVKFDGGDNRVWDVMTVDQQGAWCQAKGFSDGTYSYMDEAGCRHTCALFAAAPCTAPCTPFDCKTP